MYTVLDSNMLGIPGTTAELADLAVKYGLGGIAVPRAALEDPSLADQMGELAAERGLEWGLLPTPMDTFADDVEGDVLERGLATLDRWAANGARMGVRYCYNHVWPSNAQRAFAENWVWHLERLKRIQEVCARHNIRYGLEFLGPYELRTKEQHPFVHTIAGVMALADAAGGYTGIIFDSYHWYTGSRRLDDLYLAAANHHRLCNVHLNDGVAGKAPDEQLDLTRAMPMTTGVIDTRLIWQVLEDAGYAGPIMCEPMRPTTERYGQQPAETSVAEVAEAFRRVAAR
ncbi:MAG: sugar phosphate isomerase/epimerase family protein [Anaerolineae bacterium]|jgi:sugar phosphate isomerase/epimerase|nr:sugar phosphate isomerase/epimerase [Chloroflexota bacterium]